MDEVEIKAATQPDVEELQDQIESLRHLVGSILILAVVISGTLNIFLWRQVRNSKWDLQMFASHAAEVMSSYNADGPKIEAFVTKVAQYGQTHPDFQPILNKYGLRPPAGAAAPATQQKK